MKKISIEELCSLTICDLKVCSISFDSNESITISLNGEKSIDISLCCGKCELILIKGYEVLNQQEEVVFDMPDVEILGSEIIPAIENLVNSEPHAVDFSAKDNKLVLNVCDESDTYELYFDCSDVLISDDCK